ncbi:hypothetical protein [Legionella micdadei]|uniref:Uncharacterized protein n=1 Tax=Legionella micdadei TaxID=451 RepID=A0A098GEL6_LEGMI|nr:hypothetical protein [Legionella micdadei]ARG97528.1 hypothetical protein B6N58_07525 [Legionella micdadei]ARH00162.1 hypothetical protein B6V88_06895 [Legionella micdadei]KTD27601.1 hypothetical protein Lmic_1921 [Legionella micdadei]NSL17583.1 hypothetical protein [Legionella micdadei]CEG60914.1 protein of unknown function [Legionella micdadei]
MNRRKLIETLVSQFEEQIRKLPEQKLQGLESGKLEISLIQAIGKEAGGLTDYNIPVKSWPAPSRTPSPRGGR